MYNSALKLVFFQITILLAITVNADVSDQRLCANADCSEPISLARSLLRYTSSFPQGLSFPPNEELVIYSKSAGSNPDLWGAEIKGKRGYIPKAYVREFKVLYKSKLQHFVSTKEPHDNLSVVSNEPEVHKTTPQPDHVKQAYEVVDGTTLYTDETINPSIPEDAVQPTVAPNINQQTEPLNEPDKFKTSSDDAGNVLDNNEAETNPVEEESLVGNLFSGLSGFLNNKAPEEEEDDDDEGEDNDDEEDDADIEVEDADEGDNEAQPKLDKTAPIEEQSSPELNSKVQAENDPVRITINQPVEENENVNLKEEVKENIETGSSNVDIQQEAIKNVNIDEQQPQVNTIDTNYVETNQTVVDIESVKNTEESSLDKISLENIQPVSDGFSKENLLPVIKEPPTVDANNESLETQQNNDKNSAENTDKPAIESTTDANSVEDLNATTESSLYIDQSVSDELMIESVTADPGQEQTYDNDIGVNDTESNKENIFASETTIPVNENNNEDTLLSENTIEIDKSEISIEPCETKIDDVLEGSDTVENIENVTEQSDLFAENENNQQFENEPNNNSYFDVKATEDVVNVIETVDIETNNGNELKTEPLTDNNDDVYINHDDNASNKNNETESFVDENIAVNSDNDANAVEEENVAETTNSSGFLLSLYDKVFGSKDANKLAQAAEVANEPNDEYEKLNAHPETNESNTNFVQEDLMIPKHQSVLVITAITILLFLLGYMVIDKNRKEGPLIAKINKLEKELLVSMREHELLSEKMSGTSEYSETESPSSEFVQELQAELENAKSTQAALEEQVQSLEKELENSTEVGLELNRMLSDILNSQNGSDTLIANIEQLQKQLVEQTGQINMLNESLMVKNTENHELNLELDITNKKVIDLQAELDKMVLNLLKIEEEKEQQQNALEIEILALKEQMTKCDIESKVEVTRLNDELLILKSKLADVEKQLELKTNEFNLLKDSAREWNAVENKSGTLKSLLEVNSIKAELQQVKRDNQILHEHLLREQEMKGAYEKQTEITMKEIQNLKARYDEADKQKLEAQTKLEVLSTYFKGREAELQKELSKQENMWIERQGEATSTIERIKYMQEELQNCKAHNEALKQEIVSQEVELKSHISVLEKKAHENWLIARQAERRLEDAKQEAAQLRNRLTLGERTLNDEKHQNRVQSPLEHNGDLSSVSQMHPGSPPLLFGTQNHMTTSPPLPGLPPFLPPPPGVPFMPPPLPGVPPFLPHLPFPSDHRPAPLGRLSSPPPLNSRYSPDSRAYSPYDRNSPSPPYDSEYSPSSPNSLPRMYSPYNSRIDERKEYMRPPPVRKSRNTKVSGTLSSGSGNSNESLEKLNRHSSRV